jgi:hypothetical protein
MRADYRFFKQIWVSGLMELAWEADVLPLNYARQRCQHAKRHGTPQGFPRYRLKSKGVFRRR